MAIKPIRIFFSVIFFTSFLSIQNIYAQDTGNLSGFVSDAKTGQPLPGASVLLQGTKLGDATNKDGYFTITGIPAGTYTVITRFVGYQTEKKYNVIISSGNNPNLTIKLEPKVATLKELKVTPDPFEKPVITPLSQQQLSRVQIASYPGGNNDVTKVVQSLPGIAGSAGGFRNDIIIRGGAPSENVYYLDGIEIPVISHFATQGSAGGAVGILNVSFVENVTVTKSAFPARYGNVLSGIIHFNQRNGNASNFGANFRVSSSEAALTVEGPLFKSDDETYSNTTFIASVRRSYLQLLFELFEFTFIPSYWDYQYKISHEFNNYNEIYLTGVGSIDDFSVNDLEDVTAEQQATLDQIPIIKQWSTTAGIGWKHRFKKIDGFLRSTLSTSFFDNSYSRYRDNVNQQGLLQKTESRNRVISLKTQFKYFVDSWMISAGFLTEQVSYSIQSLKNIDNIQYDTDLNFWQYGLFSQISRQWLRDRFSVSLGIRFDGNTFIEDGNKFWHTLSPRLAISYAFGENAQWKLSATAGRYYKKPPNTILGFRENGVFINQDSDYIRSDHYAIGLSYNPRETTLISVEGFLKLYSNYPVSMSDSVSLANIGADFGIFGDADIKSVGKGQTYGLEFSIQQKLANDFYGTLAYTLYWGEFTGFNPDQYLSSRWDYRHLLTFTGGYRLPNNWQIAARLEVRGGAPYPKLNEERSAETYPNLTFDYSTLEETRLDPFAVLDVRVDKRWNFSRWSLQIYLEVQNLQNAFGIDTTPSLPKYGLKRREDGTIVKPRQIIQIKDLGAGNILPTIGIVIDI